MTDQGMFDIIVVGGGHAGVEAAWISSQFPLQVALVSLPDIPLASTPCNPAVGGVGKGQVVREIDAMGGLMGILADRAGIQYRTLNESKGYAVRSTRVQIDKQVYSQTAEEIMKSRKNIHILRLKVVKIQKKEGFFSVFSEDGRSLSGKRLILTTGTFLNGQLHTGKWQRAGGRTGASVSPGLCEILSSVKKLPRRFKTGTPPRLKRSSLDFGAFIEQKSDSSSTTFHFAHGEKERILPQMSCFIAHTNEQTLEIIRNNRKNSPLFNGQIQGIGPRYCPSIEDKAFRYPERHRHHIFVEPEGANLETIYPSGLSCALPQEVQESFIATIPGFERAEILVPGYAVEYDVVDTLELDLTLSHQKIEGLYFAGQVNGTSGYEEAAGQGLVAGINSALSCLGRESLVFSREDSYIGVMVEDLVCCSRDEPYRLFTARSENRLSIREDNTVCRMSPYREKLNLNEKVDFYNMNFVSQYHEFFEQCKKIAFKETTENVEHFEKVGYGTLKDKILLDSLLKRSHVDPVVALNRELERWQVGRTFFMPEVVRAVAISKKYHDYIERAKMDNERMGRVSRCRLDWKLLADNSHISNECRQRIEKYRPQTFAGLEGIEGIRPATLAFIANHYCQ